MKFLEAKDVFRDPADRRGLPAWTYHNAELTRLEIDRIFLRHWLFVCHAADLPKAGDYRCLSMGDERALVVRGEDGELRAFHNVCRHRAARVVPDEQGHCGKAMICPFHGWSYHLDGSLRHVPRGDGFPAMERSRFGLKPLDCETWHGLVFVRFAGDGPGVAEQFAEAEEEVSLYRIADMLPYEAGYDYDFAVDWKAALEVDNEGYHLPVGHPELFDLLGPSYVDRQTAGGLARAAGSFAGRRHRHQRNRDYVAALPADSYLPESHRQQWIYWGLFPGFVLTLFPDQVEVYQFLPTGEQRCRMTGMTYALADDRPAMGRARELNRSINMTVGDEDIRLIEWVAAGMRSSAFDGQWLSDFEIGVASFQQRLRATLPVVGLEQPPPAGTLAAHNERLLAERRLGKAG